MVTIQILIISCAIVASVLILSKFGIRITYNKSFKIEDTRQQLPSQIIEQLEKDINTKPEDKPKQFTSAMNEVIENLQDIFDVSNREE